MRCNRMRVVLYLLGKGIGQPCEAAQVHPHGEVVPLRKGRADMLGVGPALATEGMRSNDLERDAVFSASSSVGREIRR